MANLNHNSSSHQYTEGVSQGNPPANCWELFWDSNGPHVKDDTGVVTSLVKGSATSTKTATYTASAFETVLCDASATGNFKVNLPSSPAVGQWVEVVMVDAAAFGLSNYVQIDGNGNDIEGGDKRF